MDRPSPARRFPHPLLLLPLFAFASGCDNPLARLGGSRNARPGATVAGKRVPDTPEGTFRGIWRACIEGRFADAHALYSYRLRQVIPLRKIAATYGDPAARERARRLLGGARFHLDRYAGDHAFARVYWPDGRRQDLTFVREDGRWRLDITPVRR